MVVGALIPPSGMIRGHDFRLEPNDSLKESLCQNSIDSFCKVVGKIHLFPFHDDSRGLTEGCEVKTNKRV